MLRLTSFGGVTLTADGGGTVRLRSRKHLGLLLYLVSNGKRIFARDDLARLLWTTSIDRSRHSLSQALYDLRRHLGTAILRATGDQIGFDVETLEFDARLFEAAVKSGQLARAVELYEGPFGSNLVGVGTDEFDRWLDGERLRLRRIAELTLRRLVSESESKAQWGEMCVAATRLVQMCPLDERAHQALMRGLWLHGDAGSALRHFDAVVEVLRAQSSGSVTDELYELAAAIRRLPDASHVSVNTSDRELPFLGRSSEFESLRAAVRRVGTKGAGVVAIYGEAGIGKSRLLDEFIRAATVNKASALYGRCYPGEEDLPYSALTGGIRTLAFELLGLPLSSSRLARLGFLLPEFPQDRPPADEHLEPSGWRRRLYEEVVDLLRCAADIRPVVWVLDDVQWLDAASASLLQYVVRRLSDRPVLLVASSRSPRGATAQTKLSLIAPEQRIWLESMILGPLSDPDIRSLLEHAAPDAPNPEALSLAVRFASGNPFWAMEVLRATTASGTWKGATDSWRPTDDERLREILSIRFKGLPQEAIRLLQAIAVLERSASPRFVAEVAQLGLADAAECAEDLYSRGIVHDVKGRLEFVNDLLREYVYGQLTSMQRTALHALAAQTLEATGQASAALLARHFALGEIRDAAHKYATMAATAAAGSAGHMEAAHLAGIARQMAPTRQQEAEALRLQADSLMAGARLAAAREKYTELSALLGDGHVAELLEVKLRIAECCAELSEWSRGRQVVSDLQRDALSTTSEDKKAHASAEALYLALKIAIRQDDAKLATEIVQSVTNIESSQESLSPETHASLLACRAVYSMFFVSSAEALKILDDQRGLWNTKGGETAIRKRLQLLMGMAALRCAQWDAGEACLSECLREARRVGDVLLQTALLNNLACSALEQGHWDRVETLLSAAEQLQKGLEDPLDVSLPIAVNRATSMFYQGFRREALLRFQEAWEIADSVGACEFLPQITAWRGLLALQTGDRRTALMCAEELGDVDIRRLAGAQERFQIAWLQTYLDEDKGRAEHRLTALANYLEPLDMANGLKARWLCKLLFDGHLNGSELEDEERLRKAEMGWFCRFSRRWLGSARASA